MQKYVKKEGAAAVGIYGLKAGFTLNPILEKATNHYNIILYKCNN